MPFFEINLVLRRMPKNETVNCLKRIANLIWKDDGVIKKIEYLGEKKLPWEIRRQDMERFNEGSYFIYHTSVKPGKQVEMRPELKLDIDVLSYNFVDTDEWKLPENYECTLEEELLPPAFRKSVRPLLDDKNVRADIRR